MKYFDYAPLCSNGLNNQPLARSFEQAKRERIEREAKHRRAIMRVIPK